MHSAYAQGLRRYLRVDGEESIRTRSRIMAVAFNLVYNRRRPSVSRSSRLLPGGDMNGNDNRV